MALTEIMSNTWKREMLERVSGDSYVMSLMIPSFAFNRDIHSTYTDVSGEELPAGSGYTGSGEQMTVSGEVLKDDNNDRAHLVFLDVSFTPTSGEDFGLVGSAVVRNESVSGEMIIGSVDYNTSYQVSGEIKIEGFTVEIN